MKFFILLFLSVFLFISPNCFAQVPEPSEGGQVCMQPEEVIAIYSLIGRYADEAKQDEQRGNYWFNYAAALRSCIRAKAKLNKPAVTCLGDLEI